VTAFPVEGSGGHKRTIAGRSSTVKRAHGDGTMKPSLEFEAEQLGGSQCCLGG